mgnify:CR=1 FL=1
MNIESKDIYGDYPTKPCVFAACDSKYFIDHAGPFINSAHKSGKPVHVHVINPTKEVYADIEFYKEKISTTMTFTFNDMDLPEDQDQKKCIYASLRFFVLPFLLEKVQKIMVLDIDCLVMKDFKFPTKPCGLFVRQPVTYLTDWIREGTKIAAGIVYFDNTYMLAERVGFEPTIRFPVYTLSKRAPSTARPPLPFSFYFKKNFFFQFFSEKKCAR